MPHVITKCIAIDHTGIQTSQVHEILYKLKDHIRKNEFNRLFVIIKNGSLNIEGKVELCSILFSFKAEIKLHDNSIRITYKTNAPFKLINEVIFEIKTFLEGSLKSIQKEKKPLILIDSKFILTHP